MKVNYTGVGFCLVLGALCGGCSPADTKEALNKAEVSAEQAAETIANSAGDAMEEGGQMASELGGKALEFISPLKEKLSGLEQLKDSPEELKKAVTELIQLIEEKAQGLSLPETATKALASVKEKLAELKNYLEGEVEQAKIDEHIQQITEAVKSGLGMTT